ncbi:PREDICTED: uncharacterized protein LOC106747443 [Dinoponera quadriceps]|uniref:Uncharacterized protein LOC106747443 n=1 Tax=Dinoponera quadriceps TaxID=609295 RepID=A0A6P3XPK6_DINQU|nr:PREDICTED: uncharacterized protein LOC106747443 [Dinoponera quadriceps]
MRKCGVEKPTDVTIECSSRPRVNHFDRTALVQRCDFRSHVLSTSRDPIRNSSNRQLRSRNGEITSSGDHTNPLFSVSDAGQRPTWSLPLSRYGSPFPRGPSSSLDPLLPFPPGESARSRIFIPITEPDSRSCFRCCRRSPPERLVLCGSTALFLNHSPTCAVCHDVGPPRLLLSLSRFKPSTVIRDDDNGASSGQERRTEMERKVKIEREVHHVGKIAGTKARYVLAVSVNKLKRHFAYASAQHKRRKTRALTHRPARSYTQLNARTYAHTRNKHAGATIDFTVCLRSLSLSLSLFSFLFEELHAHGARF